MISHQLIVPPTCDDADGQSGGPCPWFVPEYDMIYNADEVLSVLRRHPHVRVALHGHVHANSLTTRAGIAFVTTASADEYPMQWREVVVRACEVELHTRALAPQGLVDQSAARETRGLNKAKRGSPLANHLVVRTCSRSGGARHRHRQAR